MRKNGFTFIEILGVITLLALISVIVLIVVDDSLKKSKDTLTQAQIENIKSAASMWRTDHIDMIPSSGYYVLTLNDLISNGYIDEVIDPNSKNNYDKGILVNVGMNYININNEYRALQYIESTGTQYIDINYVPQIGDVYNMTFQPLILDINQVYFGSRTTGDWRTSMDQVYVNQPNATIINGTSYINKLLFFSGIGFTDYSTVSLTEIYDYTFEILSGNYDGNSSESLYIFALNNKGDALANSNIKLYKFKIYNNNNLVRDFMPCMRKSDNKVGLYDLVNNIFYENSGSGQFVKGEL